jgi:hypothetical protein
MTKINIKHIKPYFANKVGNKERFTLCLCVYNWEMIVKISILSPPRRPGHLRGSLSLIFIPALKQRGALLSTGRRFALPLLYIRFSSNAIRFVNRLKSSAKQTDTWIGNTCKPCDRPASGFPLYCVQISSSDNDTVVVWSCGEQAYLAHQTCQALVEHTAVFSYGTVIRFRLPSSTINLQWHCLLWWATISLSV